MKNVSTIVFLLSLLAVFAPLSAVGQSQSENLQAYAYGSANDLQGGFAAVPFIIKGEARTASGISTGGESLMRYSYYFGRHFGIFASFSTDWTNLMGSDFLRTVNRADGQKYKYDPNSYDYMNVNLAAFIVGAGYRYDFGQWSLRPRIGIGYGSYYMDAFSYNRFRRDDPTNKPVHIEYEAGSKDYDYLVSTKGEISGLAASWVLQEFRLHIRYAVTSISLQKSVSNALPGVNQMSLYANMTWNLLIIRKIGPRLSV